MKNNFDSTFETHSHDTTETRRGKSIEENFAWSGSTVLSPSQESDPKKSMALGKTYNREEKKGVSKLRRKSCRTMTFA